MTYYYESRKQLCKPDGLAAPSKFVRIPPSHKDPLQHCEIGTVKYRWFLRVRQSIKTMLTLMTQQDKEGSHKMFLQHQLNYSKTEP